MAETCRPLLYEVLFMSEFITHSRAETVALGRRMAGVLQPGALIAYTGGLGAGKTAFTEGLAEGRARWPTLTCTASPPRTICARQAFTIIWIRGPSWRLSGAKILRICWPWKTPSGWTSSEWMRTLAVSP